MNIDTVFQAQHDVEYWDVASKYWKDITTVDPYWAWESYYSDKVPDTPMNILVLGVTDGSFLALLKEFRSKAWVCGIDLSFGMLKHAQSINSNVVSCRGDSLPFKNKTYDLVLSDYFLSVIQNDVKKTVKEIERVLKPNGLLVAKELRHRGHAVWWAVISLICGTLCVGAAFVHWGLSVFFGGLCVTALFMYNPVTHTMGKTAAHIKLVLHLFRFITRKKKIPTITEIKDVYFLSKKYLHIFTEKELESILYDTSLEVDLEMTPTSWNFSIIAVKKNGKRIKNKN